MVQGASNPSVAFIQRTMGRMAASTVEHPEKVRLEFYGQSITAQSWTQLVEKDLRERFPSVQLEVHKPAIGGFTSPALIRTAEHDLYPWYPDLLIFHVYGPVEQYEQIIRSVRERTTAEIVLWTSHLSARETLDTNPDEEARTVAIRDIAKRYDCMLVDVRKKWIAHVKENGLEPSALLRDTVHLNDDGVKLLAALIAPELVHVPGLQTTPKAGTVRTVAVESLAQGKKGPWEIPFAGNRVTAVLDPATEASFKVEVDGKPVASSKDQWAATRPSVAPKMWMPAIKQVNFEVLPLEEEWTLTCLPDSTEDGKKIHFRVEGSKTGADGEGFSTEPFRSRSGRVVIDPADWHIAWCLGYRKITLPEGFQVKWKTYPLAPTANQERVIYQAAWPGEHQLTLKGPQEALKAIQSLRIDSPAAP